MDDAAAIADVLHAYCDAVDELRPADAALLFATDCSFDRGFGSVAEGRDAVRDFLAASLARYGSSSHHLSNVRIQVEGDAARATSYVHAFIRFADSGDSGQLWGRYRDRLVRRDGRWLIAERVLRAAGWQGPPESRFEPMARGDGVARV